MQSVSKPSPPPCVNALYQVSSELRPPTRSDVLAPLFAEYIPEPETVQPSAHLNLLLSLRSLKTSLQKKLSSDTVDLSGIPLSPRDVRQVAFYLQSHRESMVAVDVSFTELLDDNLRLLLPLLASLPKLSTLALNGNRLTLAIVKDLTEMLKDPKMFSSLAWIDLGNNVDIFTMPQPLLVALRRRCSLKSSLPTIYEYTEGRPYCYRLETSVEEPSRDEDKDEEEERLSER